MRARFQILVIPFIISSELSVAVFQRSDDDCWQFIAGGGEEGEEPVEAARRESFEEAGIDPGRDFIKLDTVTSIPKDIFRDHRDKKGFWVIPEYCFAVELKDKSVRLSSEHKNVKWVSYDKALELLRYDGNRTALWELRQRLIEK